MPLNVTVDTKGISWLAAGETMPAQDMQARDRSGTDVDITGGTYTLYAQDGTSAATGVINSNSSGEIAITPIAYSSSLEPGQYAEVWAPTATGTVLAPIRRLAIVAGQVVQPFVTHDTVLLRLPKLRGKHPSTQNGWDEQVEQAWQEVSAWCWQEANAATWWTADGLRQPHLYLSLAVCLEACATGQGGAYTAQALEYRSMAADAFTASLVAFRDKNQDGSVDAKPASGRKSSFKPALR